MDKMTVTELQPARLVTPPAGRLPLLVAHSLFALVLLVAASLKAQSLASPIAPPGPLTWCVIAIEWLLAAWLLSGIAAPSAHRAAILLLCVFIAVDAWRLVAGEKDCGCFGNLHVRPGLTLSADLAILAIIKWAGLKSFRAPRATPADRSGQSRANRLAYSAVLSITLPAGLLWPSPVRKSIPAVVLDPHSMVGKPFPLLDFIDAHARGELMHGGYTIILFNHDCETCRTLLRKLGQQPSSETATIRIIDVASDASPQKTRYGLQYIRLTHDIRLLTTVPLRILIKDHIVQSIQLND